MLDDILGLFGHLFGHIALVWQCWMKFDLGQRHMLLLIVVWKFGSVWQLQQTIRQTSYYFYQCALCMLHIVSVITHTQLLAGFQQTVWQNASRNVNSVWPLSKTMETIKIWISINALWIVWSVTSTASYFIKACHRLKSLYRMILM